MALGSGLLALFMAGFLFVSLSDGRTLRVAKEDSFNSILQLYRAKVASYLMKADESMWLFEQRKVRSDYAESFAKGSRSILDIGNAYQLALADPDRPAAPVNEAEIEHLKSALADADRYAAGGNYAEAARLTPAKFPGYLGVELGHLATHPAERKAATAAVTYFLRHIDIDTRIRTLETAGHHTEAIRLAIGDNEGGSNWAFQGMNAAIDEIISLQRYGISIRDPYGEQPRHADDPSHGGRTGRGGPARRLRSVATLCGIPLTLPGAGEGKPKSLVRRRRVLGQDPAAR
ncbi:MAG: hypothetical protein WDN69_16285 [Aliidongia sp.]